MGDVGTVVISILGGSLGGAALGAWQASRAQKSTLRGRARLIHEDFFRLQSTVTRLYYQTEVNVKGRPEWLLNSLADKEDQQDVAAHLKRGDFMACAAALGWSEYLRHGYEGDKAFGDPELETMYKRLAYGRFVLARLGRLEYKAHDANGLVEVDGRIRNDDKQLPSISLEEAKDLTKQMDRS